MSTLESGSGWDYAGYGEFKCPRCHRFWASNKAWALFGQKCAKCANNVPAPSRIETLYYYECRDCNRIWKHRFDQDGQPCPKCKIKVKANTYADYRKYILPRLPDFPIFADMAEDNDDNEYRPHRRDLCEICKYLGKDCSSWNMSSIDEYQDRGNSRKFTENKRTPSTLLGESHFRPSTSTSTRELCPVPEENQWSKYVRGGPKKNKRRVLDDLSWPTLLESAPPLGYLPDAGDEQLVPKEQLTEKQQFMEIQQLIENEELIESLQKLDKEHIPSEALLSPVTPPTEVAATQKIRHKRRLRGPRKSAKKRSNSESMEQDSTVNLVVQPEISGAKTPHNIEIEPRPQEQINTISRPRLIYYFMLYICICCNAVLSVDNVIKRYNHFALFMPLFWLIIAYEFCQKYGKHLEPSGAQERRNRAKNYVISLYNRYVF